MKVVLLQDVPKVGKKYELKEVASGYAANFLLPRKLAKAATDAAICESNERRQALEEEKMVREDLLKKNIAGLQKITVKLKEKADPEGHLYSKVSAKEIRMAIKDQTGLDLPENAILLQEPIKIVGEHAVSAEALDKKVTFTVIIEGELT